MRNLPVSIVTVLLIYIKSTEGLLSAPLNVNVGLLDFQASIYWLPGPKNPIGTRYFVEFTEVQHFLTPVWKKTAGCTNISTLQCHMAPDQFFTDYFVRVMAEWKEERSNWTTLKHTFQPYKDTQLSSPEMKLSSKQQHSIHIHLNHRIQTLYPDVPLKFIVVIFRMTSNHTAEQMGKNRNVRTGFFYFSNLPSGYSYCINASAFYTEMSSIQNHNASACIFLDKGPRGVMICVGVLIILIISAGIVLSAKGSILRTLTKGSYFPKVLLIKGGSPAPHTLNLEKPSVLPLSVSDYSQVTESESVELNQNASQEFMEREEYPEINYELENENFLPEGYRDFYSSAALMEEPEDTEEPLAQEKQHVFDFCLQESLCISTENVFLLGNSDEEDSGPLVSFLESMESSEGDTDTEQDYDDSLESNYEPRPHLIHSVTKY